MSRLADSARRIASASRDLRHLRRTSVPRGFFSISSLLKTTVVVIGAIVVGVSAVGGTYATLNASNSTAVSTVRAGSASLTVGALSTTNAVLYPGVTSYQTATVTNTGSVPLKLSLVSLAESSSATTFSQALRVSLGFVDATTDCAAGFTGAWTGALGSASNSDLAKVLGSTYRANATLPVVANTTVLCAAVQLPATAPATTKVAATPTFVATLGGVEQ